jgi:hypothetical protein
LLLLTKDGQPEVIVDVWSNLLSSPRVAGRNMVVEDILVSVKSET